FTRVTAILRDPQRRTAASSAHRHLLSGIASCGVCGSACRILVAHGTRPKAYVCTDKFCVRRKQVAVDDLVERVVIARLSQPDALQALAAVDVSDLEQEVGALRAR